jgi:hypothetical protein
MARECSVGSAQTEKGKKKSEWNRFYGEKVQPKRTIK